jgi:hypothetical protein
MRFVFTSRRAPRALIASTQRGSVPDADLLFGHGRKRFDPVGSLPDDWVPTHDHHPTLKSKGGTRLASNSRLAHKKCNGVDVAWKNKIGPMLDRGKSLSEISDVLNDKGVEPPRGQKGWTPRSVRHAFVS